MSVYSWTQWLAILLTMVNDAAPYSRRTFLGCGLAAAIPGCADWWPRDERTRAEDQGSDWLVAQQGADGGFGSIPATALAVLGLRSLDRAPRVVDRAIEHLANATAGSLDSPRAVAMAMVAMTGAHPSIGKLAEWLKDQQRTGPAWLTHADRGALFGDHGAGDLEVTRWGMQALVEAGTSPDDVAYREGRRFLLSCRTRRGSFRESAVDPDRNKGATPDSGYGSPTCDAVLGLRATGGGSVEVEEAVKWLRSRFRVDENPGVGLVRWRSFARTSRFHWRAGVAQVFASRTDGPSRWGDKLAAQLIREQQPDGSWAVYGAPGAEEADPRVSTALALVALGFSPRHR